MTSMVGSDDDKRFAAQVACVQFGEQLAYRFISAEEDAELLGGEPTVLMPHALCKRELEKEESKALRKVRYQPIRDDRVAVVDINELVSAGWLRDLTKFFLANIHDGLQTRGVSDI